jgi:rsbT co-antagonist protein RsbR
MYTNFFKFLGKLLHNEEKKAPLELLQWSRLNAEGQVGENGKISEIVKRYAPTREVFSDLVMDFSDQFNLSIRDTVLLLKRINQMLDISLDETVQAYEHYSELYKKQMEKEVEDLSAPVVPIMEGIAVLPLIGKFDHNRADILLNKVVPEISQQQLDYLIADFSGISHLDEATARNIHEIGNVLRLLGIHIIATGISPNLALTAVHSGINLSHITSFATVKHALDYLLK